MTNTKTFINEFLKSKGANQEELQEFGRLYDTDINKLMIGEAQSHDESLRTEQAELQRNLTSLAQEVRITR